MKTFKAVTVVMMSACFSLSFSQAPLSPFEEHGQLSDPFTPIVTYNPTARPDIIVHPSTYNQIDLSIASSPANPQRILIGSYTAGFGVGYYYSSNGGQNWTGNDFLPEASGNGQYPVVSFDANGNAFYLYRQTLAADLPVNWLKKSTDGGATWLPKVGVVPEPYALYANMAIDATTTSPYANNIYVGYTDFISFPSFPAPVKVRRSTNGFSSAINISDPVTSYFSRGVGFTVDTYGTVFAVWAIYDGNGPENALGFNYSVNGGASWGTPRRVIGISGIWGQWSHKNPEQRLINVYSYPSIAVDRSGGPYRGRVYAVWADKRNGDPDIYFSSLNEAVSTDQGAAWAQPKRVNNDPLGNGKDQWMPWITVSNQGVISIVFYDSRNDPLNQLTEVWVAQSANGGKSFTNYRISDVAFTPYPVFGSGYMGTYMGITSSQGYTLPCWADNRPTAPPNPYQTYVERFAAPPQNVQITTVNGQWGYIYPKVTWSTSAEPDLVGYELWRKIIGFDCGASDWTLLAPNIGPSITEYTDLSIGTVGYGTQCTAEYKLRAKDAGGIFSDYSATVSIGFGNLYFKIAAPRADNTPAVFALHEGYPNPFNPSTQIKFDLPEAGFVSLAVYDVLGRTVADLVNDHREAGYHSATWNAAKAASGLHFVRFTVTDANGFVTFTKINKLVLIK